MINFNGKTIKYLSIALLLYCVYGAYQKYGSNPIKTKEPNSQEALFKLRFDPTKKYSEFSFTEKFIYYLYRDKIDAKIAESKKHDAINKKN